MQLKIGKLNPPAIDATDNRNKFLSRRLFIKDPLSKFEFLVDTGADVSVLPSDLVQPTSRFSNCSLAAANGTKISVFGSKLVNISFGLRREFSHSFLVAYVTKPIIGADFLHKFGLLVDIKNARLMDPVTNIDSIGVMKIDDTLIPTSFMLENSEFNDVLKDFPEVFREPDFTIDPIKHNVLHYIQTKGPLPASRARRLNPSRLKVAKEEFEYMLQKGICRPSSSPCSSPLHLVPKKGRRSMASLWRLP